MSKHAPHSDVQDVLRGRELFIDGVARPRPDVEHFVPPVEAAAVAEARADALPAGEALLPRRLLEFVTATVVSLVFTFYSV